MILSILMLSHTANIEPFFSRAFKKLSDQAQGYDDVEVLALVDNTRMSIGAKFNNLIAIARGKYSTLVGDDDDVSDTYVRDIRQACLDNPDVDCVVFDTHYYVNGQFVATCYWGVGYTLRNDYENQELFRPPGEIMCIRNSIRAKHKYQDKWRGSDFWQTQKMQDDLKKEARIPGVHYFYYRRTDNQLHTQKQVELQEERRRRFAEMYNLR